MIQTNWSNVKWIDCVFVCENIFLFFVFFLFRCSIMLIINYQLLILSENKNYLKQNFWKLEKKLIIFWQNYVIISLTIYSQIVIFTQKDNKLEKWNEIFWITIHNHRDNDDYNNHNNRNEQKRIVNWKSPLINRDIFIFTKSKKPKPETKLKKWKWKCKSPDPNESMFTYCCCCCCDCRYYFMIRLFVCL